jgi:hypothetical protein
LLLLLLLVVVVVKVMHGDRWPQQLQQQLRACLIMAT